MNDADRHVLQGASVVTVENAARLDAMEQRLDRLQRELHIQDRMLTELRRDLALSSVAAAARRGIVDRYDATKPLPDVMPSADAVDHVIDKIRGA